MHRRLLYSSIALAALGSAAALACGALGGFACGDDQQCVRDGEPGVCTAAGRCAYPDPDCPSGLRHSPHAGEPWAGACVEPDPDPVADDSGSGEPPPLPTTTTDPPDGSSGSTDAPQPAECGNGIVEGDEACDDGNALRADGCNPDCRLSGILVAEFDSGFVGSDAASDLVLLPDGDVVIAGSEQWPDEDWDIVVTRYSPDGSERWSVRRRGNAGRSDRGRAIATTPAGNLLVAGWVTPNASNATPRAQLWMSEIDPDGNVIWDALDGEPPPSNDQVWDLLVLENGDFVVVGRVDTINAADFLVRRYELVPLGDSVTPVERWSQVIFGAADRADWGFAVTADARGRIVAAGSTRPTATDIDRYLEVFLPDGFAVDPPCRDDGSTADTRVPEGNDQIRALALAPDGHIAAAGFITKTQAEGTDAWLGYYEPTGCTLLWNKTATGAGHGRDEAHGVAVDDDGFIVTVGFLRETNSDDLWVRKWNDAGEVMWQAEPLDGPGNDSDGATSVVIGPDAEIIVAGYVSKPGETDVWVGRYTP